MKSIALVVLGVLLGVGLTLAVPHGASHVVYAGTPSGNGDVNGDGTLDIADGIYIINYLLRHGPPPATIECAACDSCCPEPPACDSCCPEPPPCDSCCPPASPLDFLCQYNDAAVMLTWSNPVSYTSFVLKKNGTLLTELSGTDTAYTDSDVQPGTTYVYILSGNVDGRTSGTAACTIVLCIECPSCDSCCPPTPTRLAATGQTTCLDWAGNEIDCTSAEFPGQDGFYQKGCPLEGRFVDNGDGTVTDNCTGLMWQKDVADVNGDGMITDQTGRDLVTWNMALLYCESTEFAGYTDWRLPNVRELESILDYGRVDPAIDPVFGVAEHDLLNYWSSSIGMNGPNSRAWIVGFADPFVFTWDPNTVCWVRAVRDAD